MRIVDVTSVGNMLSWWQTCRRDLIQKYTLNQVESILDIGCENGLISTDLSDFVVGVDNAKPKRKDFLCIVGDALNLPVKPESFDCVLCLDLLEHVDDEKTSQEIWNALKESGIVIASVPAYQWLYSYHDTRLGHRQRYNKKQIKRLFKSIGFEIRGIFYWNFILFIPVLFYRMLKSLLGIKKEYDSVYSGGVIEKMFKHVLLFENKINFQWFPFGLSLFIIAEKSRNT